MSVSRFAILLVAGLLLAAPPLLAQTRPSGMHTAPGKPLIVQRTPPQTYGPAKEPVVLPRYWATTDSAQRAASYRQLVRYLSHRLRYPSTALRESEGREIPSGRFSFRLLVNPDGSIQPPTLTSRALTLAESAYNPTTVQALETEAKRVLSTLHFAPTNKVDTLTIPITFPRWW